MDDLAEKVVLVVARELRKPFSALGLSTGFVDDLHLDAMDMAGVAMAIEHSVPVIFEPGAEQQWRTIGDAVSTVERALRIPPPTWSVTTPFAHA